MYQGSLKALLLLYHRCPGSALGVNVCTFLPVYQVSRVATPKYSYSLIQLVHVFQTALPLLSRYL